MKVWAVISGDTGCDEPRYIAVVSLFATEEDARKHLENSVKQDSECFNVHPKWSEDRTLAVIDRGNGRIIGTYMEHIEVQGDAK